MATTANTILKTSTTQAGTYTKLIDIKDYPDLGASPSKLDTTTLTNAKFKTSENGLIELPDLTFTCFYDKTAYETINAMTGTVWFHLEFGEAAVDGTFEWSGTLSIYAVGAGVDEERTMTITASCKTEIELL